MILASVIIPSFNRSDVILRSLETWTNQSFTKSDYEVIVVDNNSTDNTSDIVKKFIADKSNFHYLLESRKGSTYARHAGAKLANAEILIFCDDDGLFNPGCIKAICQVYKLNPEVAAVAGKIEILWDADAPEWIEPYLFMLGKLNYGDEVVFAHDLYLNGGLFSIRKSVFEELGGFNPDLIGDYLVGDGDTGLVIKLHKANKLIGWTPHAQMQHLQFVDKQGTEKDMGRRFYNTGISNAYGFFRENNFQFNCKVAGFVFRSLIFWMKKMIQALIPTKNKRKHYFSWMQKRGEIDFFLNLRLSEVRKEIFGK